MHDPVGSVCHLTRDEVRKGLAENAILVVDVREPHEFSAGSIPGSVSMPLSSFSPADLPQDGRRIVFSCAAGVRSLRALDVAREAGLDIDAHYAGGFKDWAGSGEPIA